MRPGAEAGGVCVRVSPSAVPPPTAERGVPQAVREELVPGREPCVNVLLDCLHRLGMGPASNPVQVVLRIHAPRPVL
eukprot:CAMPEP_0172020646 /NCGR_PEP_ID=MMETSP1041-20130122/13300_1 /TAXON_ID=464988 /ORGANISM="Hemiselmis andersenii, Strain CCMP439" /LENGTH=76 /DNA_ID=CAMNT_0012675939 /DNA_START=223 /DNA_END=449 /DNA_ORIENTATION=-